MDTATKTEGRALPWNKGKLLGQKPPLKLKEIWAIRIRLQLTHRSRELALFNLAIDSKLRGCDLVGLRVHDVVQGSRVAPRDCYAEEDPAAGAIRDHRAITGRGRGMDHRGTSEIGAVPLSEPTIGVASSLDSAVLSDRRVLGRVNRTGPGGLRNAFASPHESDADLSADQESPGRSTSPRPYQTRKHRQVSRDRSRRCFEDRRAN